MYFKFSETLTHFFVSTLNISNTKGILIACITIGFFTVLIEVGKLWQTYLKKKAEMNPLTYGRTKQNISERSPLVVPMLIPASVDQINKRWLKYHTLQTVIHICQVVVGYLVMLAVMTYNAWLFMAVIISSGIGYFIFGALRDHLLEAQRKSTIYEAEDFVSSEQSSSAQMQDVPDTSQYGTTENIKT